MSPTNIELLKLLCEFRRNSYNGFDDALFAHNVEPCWDLIVKLMLDGVEVEQLLPQTGERGGDSLRVRFVNFFKQAGMELNKIYPDAHRKFGDVIIIERKHANAFREIIKNKLVTG